MTTAADRRRRFNELHAADKLFVMPNPWDVGSARLLATCGFQALATTSAGFAWALGKHDQTVTRDELVAHVAELAAATELPLNVDSERCYPDDPGGVAETVSLLAEAGARYVITAAGKGTLGPLATCRSAAVRSGSTVVTRGIDPVGFGIRWKYLSIHASNCF